MFLEQDLTIEILPPNEKVAFFHPSSRFYHMMVLVSGLIVNYMYNFNHSINL